MVSVWYLNKIFSLLREAVRYTKKVLVILLLLPYLSVFTQEISESVYKINYTVSDGLPSGETYDVFQDSKGFIWIGTDKGIARFDGNKFEVFTTNDGLTDNTVFRFIEDWKGRIWMITYNRRLCFFENGKFYPYQFNDTLVKSLEGQYAGATITNFTIDKENTVDLDLISYSHLTIDKYGNAKKSTSQFREKLLKIEDQIPIKEKLNLIDTVISGHFNGQKLTVRKISNLVANFYKLKDKIIVADLNGVKFYNLDSGNQEKFILRNYSVTGMTKDFEGGYWFSTLNTGLIYIPEPNLTSYSTKNLASNPNLISIIPQNNDLLFSYQSEDLNHYKIDEKEKKLIASKQSPEVNKIPHKHLYKGVKFEYPVYLSLFKYKARAILQIDSTTFYYAPNKEASIIKVTRTNSGKWNEENIDGPKVNKIIKDNNNKIWLATKQGLFFYNDTNHTVKQDTSHSLLNNCIQDIIVTKNNTLIFATRVNGLVIKKENNLTRYTDKNGLISNSISQIIIDSSESKLWVATNKGVCSIKINNSTLIETDYCLGSNSGLSFTDIRQIFLKDSIFYFASHNAISQVNTNKLNKGKTRPKVYLKEFRVADKNFPLTAIPLLSYNQNNLNLEFTGIAFSSFSKLKYKFKLVGLHEEWRTSNNSEFEFYALPPGEYTFLLKGVNARGIESIPLNLSFKIEPPFWLEWWFKPLSIIFISLVLAYFMKELILRYQAKAKLQVDLLRFKSMNLQSKMNPHFIFNSLNSIQHYIVSNDSHKANDYLIDFSKLVRRVLKNSDSPEIILKEEISTIQLYVDLEMRRLSGSFDFKVEVDPTISQRDCVIPALLIQPYIENAIWHGKLDKVSNGTVVLRIFLTQNRLHFEVEDNGVGYSKTTKNKVRSKSYGIGITKERIQLMKSLDTKISEVIVSSAVNLFCIEPNLGTLIQFNIPYNLKK